MTEKPIDSYEELAERRFQDVIGSPYVRWVPWSELRHQCTPRFAAQVECRFMAFMAQYEEEHAMYERRYVYVARRKSRARRRRR